MKLIKVAVLPLAVLATGAWAQIVSNGSFETSTGVFLSDGGQELLTSTTTLTGWTIVGGEIAVLRSPNAYNLAASVGNNFLDLAGYTNAGFPKGVSQVLTGLTVGQTYAFSMDLGIRNGVCVSGGDNCHGPVQASATIGSTSQTFTERLSRRRKHLGHLRVQLRRHKPEHDADDRRHQPSRWQRIHRARQCLGRSRRCRCGA